MKIGSVALAVVLLAGCGSKTATTTPATTSTQPAATETTAVASSSDVTVSVAPEDSDGPLELTAKAIGPFALGAPAAEVIEEMTKLFGPPSDDTGWSTEVGPCEGVGSRTRYVTWGRVSLTFADGPTLFVAKKGEHLSSYFVSDDPDPVTPADRFVLDDGQPALGRSANEMTTWNPKVTFPNSEIEGPLWSVGSGADQLSGMFAPPDDDNGASRTRSIRAGIFCID
jgi:hypothetical protein